MRPSAVVQASRRARADARRRWWILTRALLERARSSRGSGLWRRLYLLLILQRPAAPVLLRRGWLAEEGGFSLAVAGPEALAAELVEAVFGGPVVERSAGSARLARPRTIAAEADLEAAVVHPWHAGRWARAGWLVVPRLVRYELDLGLPWPPAIGRRGRSLERELHRITRGNFEVEEVPARAALPEFRARMVVPYAAQRFGRHAALWIGRTARRGTILFIVRHGVRLGGILLLPRGSKLLLPRLGVLDGRIDLVREGVLAAAYLHAIQWARTRGFRTLDGGLSSALARDGIHHWKRKWGFVAKETGFADRIALRARSDAGRRVLERLPYVGAVEDRGAIDRRTRRPASPSSVGGATQGSRMAWSMVLRASRLARRAAARVWWNVGGACLDGARYGPARALWRSLYLGLTLARWRTPVFLVRGGVAGGGGLSLAVAGSRKLVAELADLVLAGPSETRLQGRTLLDRPCTLAAGADLEAAFVHPWHATRWVRAGWHVSPWRLRFELDLRSPWRAAAGRRGRSLANNLRRAERAGVGVEEVAAAGALLEFRARMVVPYAKRRFGIRSSVRIGRWARGGTILYIVRDGVRLAGGLVVPRGDRLLFLRLGVLDGRTELVREGVLAALYTRTIEWGRARGFRTLDAGLACASAADGVHRWKVSWGFLPKDTPMEDRIALRARTEAGHRALAGLSLPDAAGVRN